MWRSAEQFNRHGFGSLAVLGAAVICFCTAKYVGRALCGIGMATDESYQRQGVAPLVVAHFVREAEARGLTPCWECDAANIASVRVAEKAGFVRQADEPYWIGAIGPARMSGGEVKSDR